MLFDSDIKLGSDDQIRLGIPLSVFFKARFDDQRVPPKIGWFLNMTSLCLIRWRGHVPAPHRRWGGARGRVARNSPGKAYFKSSFGC